MSGALASAVAIDDHFDNKYRVVRRLGAGGFGEVFLADDEAIPDRQVAIKVLRQDSNGDHSDLIWEMQALAKFHLPGVVGFYHHFEEEDQVFLVMEYCSGGSLHDLLARGGRLREADVLGWGLDLCETLSAVHEKGIVHHDVKPANVLFSADGRIKLGDFGVANSGGGTRHYLPPEMLLNERVSRTDARIDIYALGMTLLEALLGEHPFRVLNREEALQARIAHNFVPSSLPRWVQDVILKATHPTPELRFQTMGDFAEAIRGQQVPYVFDANRIKAHALAEKSEKLIARRKWKSAEKLVARALQLSPDCVAALLASGRCHLLIRRIEAAQACLAKAVAINPRAHVQKELGWLSLEEGRFPMAISLLTDHLQRNASDFEAYNLLLKCFYLSDRFDAAEDLARMVMSQDPGNECFRNNRFICRLLNGTADELVKTDLKTITNPFIAYNLRVSTERPQAWSAEGRPLLKSKLLFEEFRFGQADQARRSNMLAVNTSDGKRYETSSAVVSLGVLAANEIVLREASVSRRHAVVVNYPDEVWLYDLGSTRGTTCGERAVSSRVFLDGVHDISLGSAQLRIGANSRLLV